MSNTHALNEAKAIQAEVTKCLEVVSDLGRKVDLSTVAKHLDAVQRKLDPVLEALASSAKAETRAKLETESEAELDSAEPPQAERPTGRGKKKR